MQKIITSLTAMFSVLLVVAQANVYPAGPQSNTTVITNAIVHIGNGQVLEHASVEFKNGKITRVGAGILPDQGATIIDAAGKHVYPGLILSNTNLGLVEINSIRATIDYREIGDYNPNVRSLVAYDTDSKVINTLRSSGILLANIVPQGGILSGSSSVVQLDAWNWEDAAYKTDNGIHLNMPLMMNRPSRGFGGRGGPQQPPRDPVKEGL